MTFQRAERLVRVRARVKIGEGKKKKRGNRDILKVSSSISQFYLRW